MKYFIAILIKEEKQPKFFIVDENISTEGMDNLFSEFKIKKETIQRVQSLGQGVPDPLFLASLENYNGELTLIENYEKKILDLRIRKNRNILLEASDKDFMEAFSKNDQDAVKKITENKQFLRDVTRNKIQNEEGDFYNLFFNISNLKIIDGGLGYDSPPKITISPPTCNSLNSFDLMNLGMVGKQAEATCSIKNGIIYEINMKNWGCGYVDIPQILVSAPTSKDSKIAILAPVIINVLIPEGKNDF